MQRSRRRGADCWAPGANKNRFYEDRKAGMHKYILSDLPFKFSRKKKYVYTSKRNGRTEEEGIREICRLSVKPLN